MFGGRQRGVIELSHAGLEAGDLRNLAALFYQDRKKETSQPYHTVRIHFAMLLLHYLFSQNDLTDI